MVAKRVKLPATSAGAEDRGNESPRRLRRTTLNNWVDLRHSVRGTAVRADDARGPCCNRINARCGSVRRGE